jgi:adenylate cyclase
LSSIGASYRSRTSRKEGEKKPRTFPSTGQAVIGPGKKTVASFCFRAPNLSRELDTNDLSLKVGTWSRQCRDAIESAGGVVDKFLGDAIFAYWKNTAEAPTLVARALHLLIEIQQQRDPDFRIVVHRAPVTLQGGAGGANNLSGPEIIYTFRLEKVCSGLGADTIVSAAASAALPSSWSCESMGRHPLDGFPDTHEVFRLIT